MNSPFHFHSHHPHRATHPPNYPPPPPPIRNPHPPNISTPTPAGQERFRSISRLYYRGANACILCYSITDAASFAEMGAWLTELRRNLPPDIVLHVVGTKADLVARDPSRREVPFERCIAYVAENLNPGMGSTPPPTAVGGPSFASSTADTPQPQPSSGGGGGGGGGWLSQGTVNTPTPQGGGGGGGCEPRSPSSKRSSGFWGQEVGWDACHEISAESGEGVEEVFRVVTRKLVEQNRKMQAALLAATGAMAGGSGGLGGEYGGGGWDGDGGAGGAGSGGSGGGGGYFDGNQGSSFRVGRDRRSWLFSPGFSPVIGGGGTAEEEAEWARNGGRRGRGRRGCC